MTASSPSPRRDHIDPATTLYRRQVAAVVAAVSAIAIAVGVLSGPTAAQPPAGYASNLEKIRSASVRNTNHDASRARDTPVRDLVLTDHFGPRSDYLGNPAGNPETAFPVLEGGQFRATCEFSHFAYDDPIVKPGQPGGAHLHMFWGNTDVNAFSTYDTLINSGSSTCNGQELNRTGYWAPALFDARGNVRVPERIIVYYKGYGQAREESVVYPPGAAMVQYENLHTISWNEGGLADPSGAPGSEAAYVCSDQWRGLRSPVSNTIPVCDGSKFFNEYGVRDNPRATLEMHVKFGNCWNGQDPANPANWGRARIGGWFYSECESRITTPNIEYIIQYPLEVGETTAGWYLSSDIDPVTSRLTGPAGSTLHADWWGGWHPEINRMWLENCATFHTTQPSDCGMGYLTDGGPDSDNPLPGPALRFRPQYTGPIKVSAATLYNELCGLQPTLSTPAAAANCNPTGAHHPPAPTTTIAPTTTVAPTTTTVTTTTRPPTTTIAPTTTVAPTTTTVPTTTRPPTTTIAPTTTVAPTTTTVPAIPAPPNPSPALTCLGRVPTIVGTNGPDVLVGTAGDDVIHGGDGNDVIRGRGGNDLICGRSGNDRLLGGGGNDRLSGGIGDDRLSGGTGRDSCSGGSGSDRFSSCESRPDATVHELRVRPVSSTRTAAS